MLDTKATSQLHSLVHACSVGDMRTTLERQLELSNVI